MRVGLVTAVAGTAVSVATIGAVAATGAHLPHHYSPVVTHLHHKKCTKTVLTGMNDKGTAVGTTFCGKDRAFVRSPGGAITPVALPKSQGGADLAASNISSNGILAVVAPGSPSRSYLMYPKGKVVQIADPLAAGHSTIINSVNRHGVAVGYYCTTHKCPVEHAFIYHAGNYRDFTLHHKGAVLPSLSTINDSGALFGFFYQAPGGRVRSFAKHGHKVRIIDAPKAGHKLGQGTVLLNAANHHAICGGVVGKHHLNAGFVEYRGHMHLISLYKRHAGSFTEIGACNSHGQIGGHARNAVTHTYHGFVAKVG